MRNKLYSTIYLGYKLWILNDACSSTAIEIPIDEYDTNYESNDIPRFMITIFPEKECHGPEYQIDYHYVSEDEFRSEWLKLKLSKKIKDIFND